MLPKQRIYAVLKGEKADRLPITPIFMSWAAHYIGKSYRDYYLDGSILADAQIKVAREFDFDQVSAISDPFREAEGFGMQFDYPENDVPKPKSLLINSPEDIDKLKVPEIQNCSRMKQRVESIQIMAEEVGKTHSILGWIEGPIAEYSDLRGVENTMMDLFDHPDMFLKASDILIETAVNFAERQVKAGADMIGIGDAAASLIGPDFFEKYVLPLHIKLVEKIKSFGVKVKLHICGNITDILEFISKAKPDILDIDSMVDLDFTRKKVGKEITLCGNINPAEVMLQGTVKDVKKTAQECKKKAGDRFILMAGCEIPPGTPEENLKALHE